jgi:2-octaprenyl-6-methoxyphenol hydroxylase
MPERQDAIVVGGGPAGLMAAIALAQAGIDTALVARSHVGDNRTSALFAGSTSLLEGLGVWERCRADAAPLRVLRIVDDTGGLLRAPETRFEAEEIGLDAFGHNIENRHLTAALEARACELTALQRHDDVAARVEPAEDAVTVALAGGDVLTARIVIGADGRQSLAREGASIATRGWSYKQTALTLSLRHGRPHDDISTEFHTRTGPFTLVPLPGRRSSLVWVLDPATARHWSVAARTELAAEIERRSHSILGRIEIENGPAAFPLAFEAARHFARNRVALVGEAAHLIPPIGAQGLNLGLRDAAAIADLVAQACRRGDDPGAPEVMQRYDRARRSDVTSRSVPIDVVNRSLLSPFLPVHALRGLGLYLLDQVGPLRRAVMREGVKASQETP